MGIWLVHRADKPYRNARHKLRRSEKSGECLGASLGECLGASLAGMRGAGVAGPWAGATCVAVRTMPDDCFARWRAVSVPARAIVRNEKPRQPQSAGGAATISPALCPEHQLGRALQRVCAHNRLSKRKARFYALKTPRESMAIDDQIPQLRQNGIHDDSFAVTAPTQCRGRSVVR